MLEISKNKCFQKINWSTGGCHWKDHQYLFTFPKCRYVFFSRIRFLQV